MFHSDFLLCWVGSYCFVVGSVWVCAYTSVGSSLGNNLFAFHTHNMVFRKSNKHCFREHSIRLRCRECIYISNINRKNWNRRGNMWMNIDVIFYVLLWLRYLFGALPKSWCCASRFLPCRSLCHTFIIPISHLSGSISVYTNMYNSLLD